MTKDTNKDTHSIDCTDLQTLKKDRLNYPGNPLIGYLNINSIRSKISDIREVFGKLQLHYFVLSETKINESFSPAQFNIHDFEIRNRRDREKHGGGLIEFFRKGFTTKRMKEYEAKLSETICTEFTFSKKKWFCLSIYRPPSPNNLAIFFEELTDSLSRAISNYDSIILMGDFNIDIKKENSIAYDKLEEFRDTFKLTNLVKSETCFMNNHKSTIDLILTNKPRSFQITNVTEIGVSDCHDLSQHL